MKATWRFLFGCWGWVTVGTNLYMRNHILQDLTMETNAIFSLFLSIFFFSMCFSFSFLYILCSIFLMCLSFYIYIYLCSIWKFLLFYELYLLKCVILVLVLVFISFYISMRRYLLYMQKSILIRLIRLTHTPTKMLKFQSLHL